MRKETIGITERQLMRAIGGQLFDQAPNRQPRKADIIMTKVKEKFRKEAINANEYYSLRVPNILNYVKDLLMSIPEFEELNLSQIEYENGVKPNDPSRPKFAFTSRYDVETSESWKNDFIDLDAFIGNVANTISHDVFYDCGSCVNTDSDKCSKCNFNFKFTNNYKESRRPKGRYTFACKYDCKRNYYICCEECEKAGSCDSKCTSASKDCGLALK